MFGASEYRIPFLFEYIDWPRTAAGKSHGAAGVIGRPYQSERGCVKDQPQRLANTKAVENSSMLRLALTHTAALR